MNISPINRTAFNGLLTISGPDKEKNIVINTDNISTMYKNKYIDKSDDSKIGIGYKERVTITMNNGTNIDTFAPMEKVVDAYKKADSYGDFTLETTYNPQVTTKLLQF